MTHGTSQTTSKEYRHLSKLNLRLVKRMTRFGFTTHLCKGNYKLWTELEGILKEKTASYVATSEKLMTTFSSSVATPATFGGKLTIKPS
ncbi:hypothetical protein OIU77_009728 [Salix suchowensis]|uniref:Uncharacterized protein n=1 Tax=Salix suchowensis TaxID=1278906 RepID=A0ABQ9A5X3_9ROSI|nr:hypothetical protein OIU77_009728 [Salix suchowensis]